MRGLECHPSRRFSCVEGPHPLECVVRDLSLAMDERTFLEWCEKGLGPLGYEEKGMGMEP
jgi:hypothetical protein